MLRDYFYDANMHGLDWVGIYDKYLPLVGRVSTREELDDVFAQMVGGEGFGNDFEYVNELKSNTHPFPFISLTTGIRAFFLARLRVRRRVPISDHR
jgi:hypothetical protein